VFLTRPISLSLLVVAALLLLSLLLPAVLRSRQAVIDG
jgi:TctA family transporter